MGIGIIALALWLILGLDFRINEIMLFPPIISYTLLLVGLLIVYKKTMHKGFMISMILPVINIIMCLLGYTGNIVVGVIEIVLMYILFESIYKIAIEYPKVNKYKRYYRLYLIVQLIMLIVARVSEQVILSIGGYLLFVLEVLLILVIYHLVKINRFLEEDYEDIDFHIPSYTKRHYAIMSLLSLLSIGCIIVLEENYIETVNEEMVYVEELYYSIDKEEYKVIPFGYEVHKSSGIFKYEQSFYSEIRVFLKDEYLNDLETVEYRLKNNDESIYSLKGNYSIFEYNKDDWHLHGYNPFLGYTAISVEDEDVYKIELLKELENKDLEFELVLYDKDGKVLFRSESEAKKVIPTIYHYEDEFIKIENLKYNMNGNLKLPDIEFKGNNLDITHFNIYYLHEGEGYNCMLFSYSYDKETGELERNIWNRHILDEVKEFKYLQIDYHNGETIVESRICELEVTP